MFIDARAVSGGTVVESDLCIIGAGAAGIALAREFEHSGLRVCLLESGGLKPDDDTQSLYEGESVGFAYELGSSRRRQFGGSTNCWSGYCGPIDAYHFERRPWVPYSGWPVTRKELDPYYERAAQVLGISPSADAAAQWQEKSGRQRLNLLCAGSDRLNSSLYQKATSNRRFRTRFGRDLRAAKGLHVYLYANVVKIEVAAGETSVSRLQVACLNGNRFEVAARFFVLAAGGIENARLLLASDEANGKGIGNQHDLVGRFFMEHPCLRIGSARFRRGEQVSDLYDAQYAVVNLPVLAELGPREEILRSESLLDWGAHITAVPKGASCAGVASLVSIYRDVRTGRTPPGLVSHGCRVLSDITQVAQFLLGYKFRFDRFVESFDIFLRIEQSPNPDSRIVLSSERDKLGVKRPRLDWRLTELDRRTFRRAAEILGVELPQAEFGSVEIERPDLDPGRGVSLDWNWHHVGTTRMHDDVKQGVVDRNCKVHGLHNLFIAGSSVFPTAGRNVPTLTIVALAIRLADDLKRRAGCAPSP